MAFGERVYKDQAQVSRFERGLVAWTPEVLLTFAVALDTTVNRLFPWPEGIESMEAYRQQFSTVEAERARRRPADAAVS